MISEQQIRDAQASIEGAVMARLAEEEARLPANVLAAGQYLDEPSYAQRGYYGTAAAIRVIAEGSISEAEKLAKLERMLRYVMKRDAVENKLTATGQEEVSHHRIELQQSDAFRLADLCFALAFVSQSVPNRATCLTWVTARLEDLRVPGGGYKVAPEKTDADQDALATAHILRALTANNLTTRPEDWSRSVRDLQLTENLYIRCFIMYVIASYAPAPDMKSLKRTWSASMKLLSGSWESQEEANYEYKRGDGSHDYVRIPWQIYMVQAAARLFPLTRFLAWRVQRKLQQIAADIRSPSGFRYLKTSPNMSTRTYAVAFQMFAQIRDLNLSSTLRPFTKAAEVSTRILGSRVTSAVIWVGLVLFAGLSIGAWLWDNPESRMGSLAPNLVVEGFLAVVLFFTFRIRRR